MGLSPQSILKNSTVFSESRKPTAMTRSVKRPAPGNEDHLMPVSVRGTWIPIRSVGDGEPTSEKDLRDVTLTFIDGRCEVHRAGVLIRHGTYSVDTAKVPCELDVCFAESDVSELIGAPLRGIFEVDGDQLRICYGPPGGDRATSFSGEKGTGQYLAEYDAA